MLDLKEDAQGVTLRVRVAPRASRSKVIGVHDDALKVSLAAPPVEGAANAALCELLADALGVPKRAVSILHGEQSKTKVVRVLGVNALSIQALIASGVASTVANKREATR